MMTTVKWISIQLLIHFPFFRLDQKTPMKFVFCCQVVDLNSWPTRTQNMGKCTTGIGSAVKSARQV